MRKILFLFLLLGQCVLAQVNNSSKFPVFPACQSLTNENLEACFYNQIQDFVYQNFKKPSNIPADYNGKILTLFEVDSTGTFKPLYIDAMYAELKQETERVFFQLPKITPASYNGKATYAKFTMSIGFPILSAAQIQQEKEKALDINYYRNLESKEYENVEKDYREFSNPQYESQLTIPFSHSYYTNFDVEMNRVGTNAHTGSKPLTYNEVAKYYNFNKTYEKLKLNKSGWWGRKLFNENLVAIQGKSYWFTMNPIWDLQMGKASPSTEDYTFTNTRALNIQGGIAKNLNFTTTIYETQAVFADYYNRYANSLKPAGGNPAVVPGIGIAKDFKTTKYDLPSADANISFSPNKIFNLQLGYSRNFIGDGYRSLLESDGASPYPFFKINTTFWKIKYTNTYMFLKDIRNDVASDRTYASKYMANHYLSWNASKRLNVGFFESVVWTNYNGRGFDVNFVNPIIFYRSVEFSSSARSGNALLGITSKYKVNNSINAYGQLLIDEFSVGDMTAGEKSWKNKIGYQIGGKYYNAFGVENFYLQLEYNKVRPYVYAHSNPITNYGHNNQSMGHNWGSSVSEVVLIGRYNRGRLFANLQANYGVRGFDFNTITDSFNYGNDIYKDYEDGRPFDKGVKVGNGNKATVLITQAQVGYLVNPVTNLKVFANFLYRSFTPQTDVISLDPNKVSIFKENTTWFSVGLRADVFNWYFDY